jgi:hypothetical protein
MAADRPYGEFYDFYSVSPENFGSTLVCGDMLLEKITVSIYRNVTGASNSQYVALLLKQIIQSTEISYWSQQHR